jgi:hypothetical protein
VQMNACGVGQQVHAYETVAGSTAIAAALSARRAVPGRKFH